MSCKFGVRHLIDGLAWTTNDSQGRLISNDYYSLPSPFVNYWNGDYGRVGHEYSVCRCGRSYRDFVINRTRSVVLAGVHNLEIRNGILSTDVDASNINRVERSGCFMRVFTNRPFTTSERISLRKRFDKIEINFVAESDYEQRT